MSALARKQEAAGVEVVSPLLTTKLVRLPANITDCRVLTGGAIAVSLGNGSVCLLEQETIDDGGDSGNPKILPLHNIACTGLARLGAGIVSVGQDGKVCYTAGSGAAASRVLWASESGDWIEALSVSPEAHCVAVAVGKIVLVLDAEGTLVAKVSLKSSVTGVVFDKSGKRVAASHYGGVSVISVATGALEMQLAWKGAHIGITWSPDDRFLVTATQEKELHIWDLATMEDFRIGGYPRKIHRMDWMSDNLTMSCSGADAITAWPFNGGSPAGRVPIEIGFAFGATVSTVSAHPSRRLVAGGFSTGNILVGAAEKGEALVAAGRTGYPVSALSWSDDGKMLVAGDAGGHLTVCSLPDELGIR